MVAPAGLAESPQPLEARGGGSYGLLRKLWRPDGLSTAAPPRSSALNSGSPPLGRQVLVPLLLGGGWENSRAATVSPLLHRRAPSLRPGPLPVGSPAAALAVAGAVPPPGSSVGWIPWHLPGFLPLDQPASSSLLPLSLLSHSPALAATLGRQLACS